MVTEAEMPDDPGVFGAVLVLFQEIAGAGEGDLVDILFYLVAGHADAVVLKAQGARFLVGVDRYGEGLAFGKLGFADAAEPLEFGDRVGAVGNQLSHEDILLGVEPFFDDGKNVLAVDGKISRLF